MFAEQIRRARPTEAETRARRWIYVAYDRLTAEVGLLATADSRDTGARLPRLVAMQPAERELDGRRLLAPARRDREQRQRSE